MSLVDKQEKKFPWKGYGEDGSHMNTSTKKNETTERNKKGQQQQQQSMDGQATATEQREQQSVFSQGADASLDEPTTVASSWAPRNLASESASASMGSVKAPSRNNGAANRRNNKTPTAPRPQPSLTDRLGQSALSSTLGILKLAGGITLKTTGTILSPSLELTRNVVLPSLLAGIADYLSQVSPQRLKDWFRIVSASIHHLIAVIVSTERGSTFRHKVVRVGGDLVDVASSEQSQQALMDGIACFIKFSEALHTPEFKAFLEHLGVVGCRIVDAASMGKNKKLIHDFYDLLWSGVELANDPATTVAMAEVAAYLCHALEMEDAAIYTVAKEREAINQKAALQRKERDQYQKSIYNDAYLFRDPNATVEEVILSAMGVIKKSVEEAQQIIDVNPNIPGSVVLGFEEDDESKRLSIAATSPPEKGVIPTTIAQSDSEGEEDTAEKASKKNGIYHQDIDVGYLRERISKRAMATKQRQFSSFKLDQPARFCSDPGRLPAFKVDRKRPAKSTANDSNDDSNKKDIEDLSSLPFKDQSKRRTATSLDFEDVPEDKDDNSLPETEGGEPQTTKASTEPLEGEAPVAHFYRILDQVLADQRKKSVKIAADRNHQEKLEALLDGTPEAAELKKHLQRLRSAKRVGDPVKDGIATVIEKWIVENQFAASASVLFLLCLALVFFAFGFYGMYVFTVPAARSIASPQKNAGSEIHVPVVIHDELPGEHHRGRKEYVIRVVREVVHVNSKGEVLNIHTQQSDEL